MENASHMPIACGYLDIRVLLIEDSPADARLVQEILAETRNSRFRLEHTNHLSAGLKLLAQEKFDLLLLDLNLPDSYRLKTFEKVQARPLGKSLRNGVGRGGSTYFLYHPHSFRKSRSGLLIKRSGV